MIPKSSFTCKEVVDIIKGPLLGVYTSPHWLSDAIIRLELGINDDGKLAHVVKNGTGWRCSTIEEGDSVYFDEWVMKVGIIKGD